ncbi:MAG: c-type cytochrome [Verrucomicrobiae bacterium]|nr:c-type cytochrome [Verrucomicrobiae bacterium]
MKTFGLILLFAIGSIPLCAADWQPVSVPGPVPSSGTGWLRCWVKPHDSFFTKHERNLFEESVGFHFSDLPGSHEVWVNGVRIGAGSEPGFLRYKVPMGTLSPGQWNEISVKTTPVDGAVGFRKEAPFLMNYFWECVFEGGWEFLEDGDYIPGKALAEKPARAAFEEFRESNRVLGRAEQVHGPKLSPQEAAKTFTTTDGLTMEQILAEPDVEQPFHFSYDGKGRLWVIHSRQYPYPAGLRMLSRDRYYRAHYDKVPLPPPNHDPGADLVTIHEDTDGDGRYDTRKVFVEGLNMANAVLPGKGGVWVMNAPYLLFYPDVDGNDVPDGDPVVHLSGFGFEDSHSAANGLVWGPDGWIYGGQGSTVSCRVVRPGLDPEGHPGVYFEGCMVWRYHPGTRAFEIFAEGSGNTFGLEFDSEGRLYSGHNGGGTRGWHYVQGGFYLMQGVDPGKFGPPRNPYAFGELPMMSTEDKVVRFTHFGAFADGTAMPEPLRGMLFAIDPLHNEIIASKWEARGSTFETVDHGAVVKSSDPAFRPVYIANAPDGSLHVGDMYEFYIAHGQHYQNQIDPTSGRIYRVAGKGMELENELALSELTSEQLVEVLGHPNKWHRRTAVRLLGERADEAVVPKLKELAINGDGSAALHALWALYQVAGLDDATAEKTLAHSNPAVRSWTVRLLGDAYGIQRNLGLPPARTEAYPLATNVFEMLLARAASEDDAEVRSQMASSARRLANEQAFPLLSVLLTHDEDVDDAYIPLLCWWVLEAHLPSSTADVMTFFRNEELWDRRIVKEHLLPRVARRFSVEGKRQELLQLAELLRMAPGTDQAKQLLIGFEEAYRGRTMTALPEELLSAMADSGGASLGIRLRQGDESAVKEALDLIADSKAPLDERLRYTRSFGEIKRIEAVPVLLSLATVDGDVDLRRAALASLGSYDDTDIAVKTLAALPSLPEAVRPAAFTLLGSRPAWAGALIAALQSGSLSLSLVPGDVADQLRSHAEESVRTAAVKLFPKAETAGMDFNARIASVEEALKKAPGNPYAGEPIFEQRCASCHKLFFKGGRIGPELTGYQRDDLGTMLISIVNPNAEIREGFQFITVKTKDGRTLGGFQVDRDNQVTVLRGLDGQDLTLSASEIDTVEPMGRSLMPEGLLEGLDEQQLRDLFAYLRISQPISK